MRHHFPADLEAAAVRILIESMHPGLKDAIDDLIAKGATKKAILTFVRGKVEGMRLPGGRGKLTLAGIEAYLDSLKAK